MNVTDEAKADASAPVDGEKQAHLHDDEQDKATEEEEAKARPERTATFQDYIVRLLSLSDGFSCCLLADLASICLASVPVCD